MEEYRKFEEQLFRTLRGMGVDIDNIYTADRVALIGVLEKTFQHGRTYDNTKISLSESSIKSIEVIRNADSALNQHLLNTSYEVIIEHCLSMMADKIEATQAWLEMERKLRKSHE